MTHSARSQRKPLSVRTRALIHKYHERIVSQRISGWNSYEMRLRARIGHKPWSITTGPYSPSNQIPYPSSSKSRKVASNNLGDHSPGLLPADGAINELDGGNHTLTCRAGSSSCSTSSTESSSITQCKWDGCGSSLEQSQLITHIQHVHVLPQMLSNRRKCFVCLWEGCRVYRRPSVSAAWLESHILHHTDAKGKPFRCIFDGCTLRFSTSILLERHVQRAHMRITRTQTGSLPIPSVTDCLKPIANGVDQRSNGSIGSATNSPVKSSKRYPRRRRRIRGYRVRRVDFYDKRSQCVIENRLKLKHLLDHENIISKVRLEHLLQHQSIPKSLIWTPSKPRLRSSSNSPSAPTKVAPRSDSNSRRMHLTMLLTIPHTYAGRRLLDNNCAEILVRWIGGSNSSLPPPTWITEEELKAATILGSGM